MIQDQDSGETDPSGTQKPAEVAAWVTMQKRGYVVGATPLVEGGAIVPWQVRVWSGPRVVAERVLNAQRPAAILEWHDLDDLSHRIDALLDDLDQTKRTSAV